MYDTLDLPKDGWSTIEEAGRDIQFTHGHMIAYFVSRRVSDSLPASDIKSISEHAYGLCERGHVQKIEVINTRSSPAVYIRANCFPEMKKDRTYKIQLQLERDTLHISGAECGCPAGRGPVASCKHIGALCYVLEKFGRLKEIPDYRTCTDQLQVWNQPRPKRLNPVPVQELKFQKLKYARELLHSPKPLSTLYDPRPTRYRTPDEEAIQQLYIDLQEAGKPCGFLHILGPVVEKADSVRHDHTYATTGDIPNPVPPRHTLVIPSECDNIPQPPVKEEMTRFKQSLNVHAASQPAQLEQQTRGQHNNQLWFAERKHRITASICGKVLQRPTRAVVREILYSKPMVHLPPPIAWGRRHEGTARTLYEQKMTSQLHRRVTTQDCGLFVHPVHGWLGATPDATLHIDTSQVGILEIKCPYRWREDSVFNACKDPNFYCTLQSGEVFLKRQHHYYHQVQMQLYVTAAKWCDFCIYTTHGIAIQRIYPDRCWQTENVPKLEDFYDNLLLPEILYPRMKPSYVL